MSEVEMLLDLYPDRDELFDVLDITLEEVVEFLLEHGKIALPPFLERYDDAYEREE